MQTLCYIHPSVYIHLACCPQGKHGQEWACYWTSAAEVGVYCVGVIMIVVDSIKRCSFV